MADTIITNSPERDNGNGSAGWIVALILIIVVVVGGIILYRRGAFRAAAPASNTNINVTVPNPVNSSN